MHDARHYRNDSFSPRKTYPSRVTQQEVKYQFPSQEECQSSPQRVAGIDIRQFQFGLIPREASEQSTAWNQESPTPSTSWSTKQTFDSEKSSPVASPDKTDRDRGLTSPLRSSLALSGFNRKVLNGYAGFGMNSTHHGIPLETGNQKPFVEAYTNHFDRNIQNGNQFHQQGSPKHSPLRKSGVTNNPLFKKILFQEGFNIQSAEKEPIQQSPPQTKLVTASPSIKNPIDIQVVEFQTPALDESKPERIITPFNHFMSGQSSPTRKTEDSVGLRLSMCNTNSSRSIQWDAEVLEIVPEENKSPDLRRMSIVPLKKFNQSPLDLHPQGIYNFLHRRRSKLPAHELTPLEGYFVRESLDQYRLALDIVKEESNLVIPSPLPQLKRSKRCLLVLDLDETLVHAEAVVLTSQPTANSTKQFDRTFRFPNEDGSHDVFGVRYRPFVHEFLARMAAVFDVAVYTASMQDYADAVVDTLDPTGAIFCGRLYREHCTILKDKKVKNMDIFTSPDTLLVDNLLYSFAFHMNHGVPILPFVDDMGDMELRDLACLLERVAHSTNLKGSLDSLLGLSSFYDDLASKLSN